MRRFQIHVGNDHNVGASATFDVRQVTAFFIEQEGTNSKRHLNANDRAAFFEGFFFHYAQDSQGQ